MNSGHIYLTEALVVQSQQMLDTPQQDQALCKLLTAASRHASPEALPQSLRMAASYHSQALSPDAVPSLADSSMIKQPDSTSSPKDAAHANSSKPGLVGAAVHVVGSILHSALGSSSSSSSTTISLPDSAKGTSDRISARGSDSPPASGGASPRTQAGSAESRQSGSEPVLANGDTMLSTADANGDVAHGEASGSSRVKLLQRIRAVQFHDALLTGVADRVHELAPEHTFGWYGTL